jgi:ribonuclease-3
VRDWLIELATPELAAEAPIGALKSPKSRLQEYTQRRSGDRPSYRLVEASGPDHEKSFRIEVWVDGELLGVGEGPSRRTAETAAAAQALDRLRTAGAASGPEGSAA